MNSRTPPRRTKCGFYRCTTRPSRGFMGMFCAKHARELERIKAEFDAKQGHYRIWGSARHWEAE